jgi:hypothetical protein
MVEQGIIKFSRMIHSLGLMGQVRAANIPEGGGEKAEYIFHICLM